MKKILVRWVNMYRYVWMPGMEREEGVPIWYTLGILDGYGIVAV